MKKSQFYVIGNWKSNKSIDDVVVWCQDFATLFTREPVMTETLKVVLCVPFIHISTIKSLIALNRLPLRLGVQTVSSFAQGAYTGEVSAAMLKDLVEYTLIGHSERRNYFKETDQDLGEKVKQTKNAGIEPVYCIPNETAFIPDQVNFVGYEPVWAIGTGKAESPENANKVAAAIKARANRTLRVIYGGSVTADNVAAYATMEHIDGVLPGGASLKPDTFHRLIVNASHI